MTELLSKFDAGELIGLVATVGGFLCGLSAIVMGSWLESRKAEIKAALKQDMLNRGMTADEIRTVIEAGSHASRKELRNRHVCQG